MSKKPLLWLAPHLLQACDGPQLVRLARRYVRRVQWPYTLKALTVPAYVAFQAPFRWVENALQERRIRRQELRDPLVFIIGHWRSGTTNVHNHFLQDPRFGCITLRHCLFPHTFLSSGWLQRAMIGPFLRGTRPMDAVPVGLDAPMSEDFALVGVNELTHYLGYFFPNQLEETFRRTVFFEGVTPAEIDRWADAYDRLLRKATLASGGRAMVTKNPPNAGRVPHLLERFPQAKYVYVYRNPFVVHASTCKLMRKFLERWSLQRYDFEEVEAAVLRRQALLLRKYFADRERIPEGRLVEIRHEEMTADPLGTMEHVYRTLDLPGFEQIRPRLEAYVASIRDYATNTYEFAPKTADAIRSELGFALDEWGYDVPAATPVKAAART